MTPRITSAFFLILLLASCASNDSDPVVSIGRYTGTEMNIGFFSRNREINLNSSMSVHG